MAILTTEKQHEIDARIESLELNLDFSYPEKNLVELAEKMNISVFVVDLVQNVSGIVRYNEEKKPEIFLNRHMGKERRTFTLAHEIGHLVLNHVDEHTNKYRVDTFDYKENTSESLHETEANYFAASLLVPKRKLLKVLSLLENDPNPIPTIARYFGVSEAVITNRLRWLRMN